MRPPLRHAPRPGFTLIELLIVVAIIAILAAIAVPNFLEAQTRAKIGRARADARSIATALEAYRVDALDYPEPHTYIPFPDPGSIDTGFLDRTRIPSTLTTPVAYLTALPPDVFAAGDPIGDGFHYLLRRERKSPLDPLFTEVMMGEPNARFYILSLGPNVVFDASVRTIVVEQGSGLAWRFAEYDATNGTVSAGDLIRWGP
jgi:prepilin-type N-terminal cleavage/methylation domain-containing protein